jgi:hypothetical protein
MSINLLRADLSLDGYVSPFSEGTEMRASSQLRRIAAVAGTIIFCATGIAAPALAQQRSGVPVTGIKGTGIKSVSGDERNPVILVECKPQQVSIEVLVYTEGVQWDGSQCICRESVEALKKLAIDILYEHRANPLPYGNFTTGFIRLKPGETNETKLYCYDFRKIVQEYGKPK